VIAYFPRQIRDVTSSDHGNVTIYSIRHANDLPRNLMAVLVTAPTERFPYSTVSPWNTPLSPLDAVE
jgi:hypothetical protein